MLDILKGTCKHSKMGGAMESRIDLLNRRKHTKASEEYVDVIFRYPKFTFEWSIPIEYRRTGTHLANSSDAEIETYVGQVYEKCHPDNWAQFEREQIDFWKSKPKASITKEFFDILANDFQWQSVKQDLPNNSNSQRRIQDLKEFGFTIATNTRMQNPLSKETSTHHLLLPLPRGGITGYETWSPNLRNRIIKVLGGVDAYEVPGGNVHNLLPDHKFPEIRWDTRVRREDLEKLSDDEIARDFQLITNQRNQQKREACRKCFQTSTRATVYGINFFAEGGAEWPKTIPTRGKSAEAGCVGCGWYDLVAWRKSLNRQLGSEDPD